MHQTEKRAASRWVWTYVAGQRGSRLIVKLASGIRNDGRGTWRSGNRFRASDRSEDQTIRKANGNSSNRQEERNSRVADIGTGVTGASWAAFYVTKGLDVTARGKKEARLTTVKAAQGKA